MKRFISLVLVCGGTTVHTVICNKIGYDSGTWQGWALYGSALVMMVGGMIGCLDARKEENNDPFIE